MAVWRRRFDAKAMEDKDKDGKMWPRQVELNWRSVVSRKRWEGRNHHHRTRDKGWSVEDKKQRKSNNRTILFLPSSRFGSSSCPIDLCVLLTQIWQCSSRDIHEEGRRTRISSDGRRKDGRIRWTIVIKQNSLLCVCFSSICSFPMDAFLNSSFSPPSIWFCPYR